MEPDRQVEEPKQGDQQEHADLDLSRIGGIFRRRARLMTAVLILVVAATAAITWLMTPIYKAEVTLLVEKAETGSVGSVLGELPLLGGAALGSRTAKTQEILLEHPDLAERAAKELGLLEATQSIEDLDYKVQADSDVDSDIIMLTVEGPDPGKAADLANRITDRFLKRNRELAQQRARQAAHYIQGELRQMEQALARSEEELRQYQAEHGLADIQASITASINRAATLGAQSDTAQSQRAGAQQAADYFRRKLAKEHSTYIASSTIAQNPVVQKLEADLSDAQVQRAAQSAIHGPDHPDVKRLDQRIAEITKQLANAMRTVIESQVESSNPVYLELAKQLATSEAEAARAGAQEAALAALRDRELARMAEWPNLATELDRLRRDTQVTSDLYVTLMKNYQQMRINEAIASPGVSIVARAKLPDEPVRPQKALNLVLGAAVGLLLAFLAAALAEASDDRMRSPDDVSHRLGLKSLGVLPASPEVPAYVAGKDSDSLVGDYFRALRTNLRFACGNDVPRRLLVTSSGAGEGKTTVAIGLAMVLAQNGRRVLLADANLRQSPAHWLPWAETAENGRGFSEALAGLADPLQLVVRTRIDGLWFLPRGEAPRNPVELFDSHRAVETLDALGKEFDIIILDAPHSSVFVETLVAAAMCDALLLVIDATTTRARDARLTVNQLANTGTPLLGAVLNRATHRVPALIRSHLPLHQHSEEQSP